MKKLITILGCLALLSGCSTGKKNITRIDVSLDITCGQPVLKLELPINFENAKKVNNQTVAYISVDGVIEEPIVQTTNNNFYVRHDIHRKYSSSGTVFMDYETQYLKHFNTIIYGHTSLLVEGSKFSNLNKYKNEDFYKSNKFIQIQTDSKIDEYEVIGVSIWENKKIEDEAPHFMMYDMLPHEGRAWINDISKNELYPIARDVSKISRVITLVTCDENNIEDKLIIYAAKKG